ncbi:hypothetical protein [Anaeromicrobium sediminis]|uniref:Lipoprotein n=1 Tax=Anaeromicrobium sediminis TaxID=1478221 RepID=A0A267MIM8_9FIRM|nr:hypothetical protein [Anaeromicrobium sediminis]PAB59386.1 hypothetical protein CCE28_11040 [Anaeromicrobium sediminis]
MKKRNIIFTLILSICIIFTGCSNKKEGKKEVVQETKKIEEKNIEKVKEDVPEKKEIKEENKEEEKIEEPKVEKKVEKPINKEVKNTEPPKTGEVKEEPVQVVVNKEENKQENVSTEIVEEVKEEVKEEVVKPSEEEIITKYTLAMEGLRIGFEGKLKALMGEARAEYMSYPEEERGSKKISLGLKYLRKANALEDECDNEVEVVLSDLKNELIENEYDTKIVQDMKVAYDTEKSEKRSALMKKALKKE